ncbi:ABC transporter ATP-binding protein [Halobacteria archaeon AArc-curdl1]|uniref:ABC transporter ATP-binding protein n=1 Tax=Natronosalvus hydrolyticus TaxID=2979988 RepID=A0AAP2Z9K2_9EURY|nr:ABC transporter ATP-binding protein [Halobacteria archaeon AArc-curdl1]
MMSHTSTMAVMDAESSDGSQRNQPLLDVQNLTKKFGGLVAVNDLSFQVDEGEILGFIGPNGAGKSTTFNCLTGKHKPTEGTVTFRGEEVTSKPPHEMVNKGMARTFQHFAPLYDRSVLENVALAYTSGKVFSWSGLFSLSTITGTTYDAAAEICARVGLQDDLHRMPGELPHAGLIRLELGRALATDPKLMLVDEVFAGLASGEVEEISNLLLELHAEGMTLIVIDHNMSGLFELIDRAIVINFGEMIAKGTPEEIKNDPEVQKAYLGGEEL